MGNKIRVLVLTNTYPSESRPGDTPSIKDQVEDLRGLGVSVDVLYIDGSRKINYLLGSLKIFFLSFMPRKYDLIHAFYGHSGALAQLQRKYPVLVTFLGSDLLSKKDNWIGKYAARKADGVIVMTDEMRRVSNRPDARVIPFGANISVFKPRPRADSRNNLGLSLKGKLVLFPWDPTRSVKRYWIAEETVEKLRKQYSYDVNLLTIFNQPREIIARYMNACDVMILTSKHEGAPLAVREALASRLPVVSVDVGDVRAVVESVCGGYIAECDATDLAEKISWVFEEKGNLFEGFEKPYGSQYSAKKVLTLYEEIIYID